jgi:hypothetical protein
MSSFDSPRLKPTTGIPETATNASSSATSRSWLRLRTAGDGIVLPLLTRNLTTPPSYCSPGMYPRIPMRSTELQRKLTCWSNSLATAPMAASSPTVAAVDQRGLIGGRYGGHRLQVDEHRTGGHRAGFAGPAPTCRHPRSPNASELRPPGRATTVN